MIDLSIVIPAHNEEGVIGQTVRDLALRITREGIVYEIVVVYDNSTDQTGVILEQLRQEIQNLKVVDNPPPYGFGFAVRHGIEETGGNHIAIMMADASDDPEDLICFFRKSEAEGVDAVFFHANQDQFLDLYVANGGNEYFAKMEPLKDCLYFGLGNGYFRKDGSALPEIYANSACVKPVDIDQDGDLDLFVGSRSVPREYGTIPQSYLLLNDGSG